MTVRELKDFLTLVHRVSPSAVIKVIDLKTNISKVIELEYNEDYSPKELRIFIEPEKR